MEPNVLLTICSVQQFQQEAPEVTRLETEGQLSIEEGAVCLSYPETELTGLAGTKTSFRVEDGKVTLEREGAVESRMVFAVGQEDRSLYDMGFGALMIAIRTEKIESNLTENGGTLTVSYGIVIEEEAAGTIRYEIKVRPLLKKR